MTAPLGEIDRSVGANEGPPVREREPFAPDGLAGVDDPVDAREERVGVPEPIAHVPGERHTSPTDLEYSFG